MNTPFTHKTSIQIQARLQELAELEAAHTERDMDAELAEVMRRGGDLDAMETAQLEAERTSRRLRVERAALETELPLARKREGIAKIAELSGNFEELVDLANRAAEELVRTWDAFSRSVDAWDEIQKQAMGITSEVGRIATDTASPVPELGNFRSSRVMRVARATSDIFGSLALADRETPGGPRLVQSRVLD